MLYRNICCGSTYTLSPVVGDLIDELSLHTSPIGCRRSWQSSRSPSIRVSHHQCEPGSSLLCFQERSGGSLRDDSDDRKLRPRSFTEVHCSLPVANIRMPRLGHSRGLFLLDILGFHWQGRRSCRGAEILRLSQTACVCVREGDGVLVCCSQGAGYLRDQLGRQRSIRHRGRGPKYDRQYRDSNKDAGSGRNGDFEPIALLSR